MLDFREKSAGIDDLVVVNFRTRFLSPAIREWKDTTPVAMAESCARQIWFGEKSDFTRFPRPHTSNGGIPDKGQPQIEFYEGPDAYAFLLKLVTGMDSVREGETNIAGQFYPGWAAYEEAYPHRAKRLQTIIQHLRADSSLIRSQIVSGIKPKRHELAARKIACQLAGDHAVLIGSLNNNGVLSNYSAGMVKALANNRSARVSRITVTHPDPAITGELLHQIARMHKDGIVNAHVDAVDFSNLPALLSQCDCAFVDLPMGADEQADRKIIDAWRMRDDTANSLTHLRGDPLNRALSNPLWATAGLQNYNSPEDIRTEMIRIDRSNATLRQKAMEAIGFCTNLRLQKQSPSRYNLQNFFDGGQHNPVNAPRPLA